MIRRPPRSTLSSSSAASDVYKRQAPGILLSEQPVDRAGQPRIVAVAEVDQDFEVLQDICNVRRGETELVPGGRRRGVPESHRVVGGGGIAGEEEVAPLLQRSADHWRPAFERHPGQGAQLL